jgi:hypothetical protein
MAPTSTVHRTLAAAHHAAASGTPSDIAETAH